MKNGLHISLVFAILFLCLGCADQENSDPDTVQYTPVKKQLYIELTAAKSLPYFQRHRIGLEDAASMYNVRTELIGPDTLDINALINDINRSIARKPDGLIIFGIDERLNGPVQKAIRSGIPVITVDSDLPDSGRACYIGTNNFDAGIQGGEYAVQRLDGQGDVVIFTHFGQHNLLERLKGYESIFADYPDINIISIEETEYDPHLITKKAGEAITNYPDLKAIICIDNNSVYPTAMAIRGTGKTGAITLIGTGVTEQVLNEIEAGVITAVLAQRPELMTFYAVQMLHHQYTYTSSGKTKLQGGNVLPVEINTGAILIDKSNLDYYAW